ncbi:MAG: AraC family transcriptional regulator [Oscillospiraceae bacterium]|nr:AraC family transcriptional regulator [Oscillospiraceae bacterium]
MIILIINSIGFNNRQSEFYSFSQTNGADFLTLYIFKTNAYITLGNKEQTYIPANSFIIISPDTPYKIKTTADICLLDWIQLENRDNSEYLSSYSIASDKVYRLHGCSKTDPVFEIIMYEYYRLNSHKDEIISKSVDTLLSILSDEANTDIHTVSSPYYTQLFKIREKIHSNPSRKWTVDELCGEINLSRSYFQLLYRETFGITCINDVIECKISLAKKSLSETTCTVSSVAQMCGYDSDVHFMRQFKKITGLTPSEYRKQIVKTQKR